MYKDFLSDHGVTFCEPISNRRAQDPRNRARRRSLALKSHGRSRRGTSTPLRRQTGPVAGNRWADSRPCGEVRVVNKALALGPSGPGSARARIRNPNWRRRAMSRPGGTPGWPWKLAARELGDNAQPDDRAGPLDRPPCARARVGIWAKKRRVKMRRWGDSGVVADGTSRGVKEDLWGVRGVRE